MSDNFVKQIAIEAARQEEREKLLKRLPRGWTGNEIMTTSFPPIQWAVNGLIPSGAILLSGMFKVGKSWMMLQLADCVSQGKPFLGHDTNQGKVLYLALEDGPARIKERASKMGISISENVYIFNNWLSGIEGLTVLDAWLEKNRARLVIIDTLSRWQDEFHGSDIWKRDTKRIASLKAIADNHKITILIVHHRSKMSREDIHQSIAGTNALQGAADGSLILDKKRNEHKAKLSILGRDIPESELALEFIQENCTWRELCIDPIEMTLNSEQKDILEAIRDLGGIAKVGDIAKKLEKEQSNISHQVFKLVEKSILGKTGYGKYEIISPDHSIHTNHTQMDIDVTRMNTLNTMNDIREMELVS